MTHHNAPSHVDDFGVADMFLAGRTDVLSEDLTAVFHAASGPARASELAGAADAMETFLTFGPGAAVTLEAELSAPPARMPMRRRLVASMVAAGLLLTGVSAAAYAGALPGPLQTVADRMMSAGTADSTPAAGLPSDESTPTDETTPESTPTEEPTSSPEADPSTTVKNNATGPAAYGLCTAFTKGGLAPTSTSYANLVAAAGGVDQVDAYCADVIAAKKGADPTAKPPKTTHEKKAKRMPDKPVKDKAPKDKAPKDASTALPSSVGDTATSEGATTG
jgi:hypothetical protein